MTSWRSIGPCGAALGALLLAGAPALAQVPTRTRGTITAVSDDTATLRTPMGHVTVKLPGDKGYVGARKASLDDIKANTFIGTAAVPQPDGTLRALEVTVFPESMRGAGEGSYPWDLGKSGSMTNGTVSSMTNGTVSSMSGGGMSGGSMSGAGMSGASMTNGTIGHMSGGGSHTMQVGYKGGQKTVVVPDTVPVVELEPGSKALLKPGARVVVFGPVSGDTVQAMRIIVGEDGVRPPM